MKSITALLVIIVHALTDMRNNINDTVSRIISLCYTISVFNFEGLNFRGWREQDNFEGLYFRG